MRYHGERGVFSLLEATVSGMVSGDLELDVGGSQGTVGGTS